VIPPERLHRSRILVVDDQKANVLLLERLLMAEGYTQVLTTTEPMVAEELWSGFRPDLVLLDLHMPGLDGFELLERLKATEWTRAIPVLVLTADDTRPTRLRALEAGARDFLTKPFDPVEVLTRIRNMLEVRLLYLDLQSQNERLEETVRERTRELQETRLEVIYRLSRAAEFRDEGTGLHLMRISGFSRALATAAGMDKAQTDLVFIASPMHDLGKIGIPDRILLKPAPLDETEWAVMRTHPLIGAELLSGHDSPLMRTAAAIALAHHERWDGRGYPRGLSGEEIPLEGRIVAICDVFDALLSLRPYKRPWPLERAVAEIEAHRGTAFDPALVDRFLAALPELSAIHRDSEKAVSQEAMDRG